MLTDRFYIRQCFQEFIPLIICIFSKKTDGMTDKRGRKNKYGEKNACFRGCEYIREGVCVYTRRHLRTYAQTFMYICADVCSSLIR